MATTIQGNDPINVGQINNAKVDNHGRLLIDLEVDAVTKPEHVGAVKIFSENDNGLKTGEMYLKSPETSADYRLRVGIDNLAFEDTFNSTTQNTNLWSYTFVTLTAAQPGAGTVNFGTVQGTAGTHGAFMRTFQYFPIIATAPLAIEFVLGQFNTPMITNEVFRCGIGLPTSAVATSPDGVCIQLTSAGLEGIISYNGTEYSSGIIEAFSGFTLSEMYKITISIGEREIEYWKDDVLLAEQEIPSANGVPFLNGSLPIFMHKYCTGSVTNTNTIRVARTSVLVSDIAQSKPWNDVLGTMSRSGYVGQNGFAMGSTSGNFGATAALVATQAGSNTTPNAAMAGLGGIFQMTAQVSSAGASGDTVAQYYLNPASTINITGRNLVIKSVRISTINYGAVIATTPTTLVWGLAYGHTAVSLATTETASFATATTHAPRRLSLGMQYAPIGAVIGQLYSSDIEYRFNNCPVVVRPGEYVATTCRFLVGTATASQTIVYTITYDCYFE